jgi:hypothetical protein
MPAKRRPGEASSASTPLSQSSGRERDQRPCARHLPQALSRRLPDALSVERRRRDTGVDCRRLSGAWVINAPALPITPTGSRSRRHDDGRRRRSSMRRSTT